MVYKLIIYRILSDILSQHLCNLNLILLLRIGIWRLRPIKNIDIRKRLENFNGLKSLELTGKFFGDFNTKFFHRTTKIREQVNSINALLTDDNMLVDTGADTCTLVDHHFINLFSSTTPNVIQIRCFLKFSFPQVGSEYCIKLIQSVNIKELHSIVNSIKPSKAPGHDGF